MRLENVAVSGERPDVLTALLANSWVAPCALLFRREIVQRCGGWDESLEAAQDRDFMVSLALSGTRILYQPGCYSIYRHYGNVTVGTKQLGPGEARRQPAPSSHPYHEHLFCLYRLA